MVLLRKGLGELRPSRLFYFYLSFPSLVSYDCRLLGESAVSRSAKCTQPFRGIFRLLRTKVCILLTVCGRYCTKSYLNGRIIVSFSNAHGRHELIRSSLVLLLEPPRSPPTTVCRPPLDSRAPVPALTSGARTLASKRACTVARVWRRVRREMAGARFQKRLGKWCLEPPRARGLVYSQLI